MKVVRLSAVRAGRLYPAGNIPGTHFSEMLNQPQGHSVAGRLSERNLMDMWNISVNIGFFLLVGGG